MCLHSCHRSKTMKLEVSEVSVRIIVCTSTNCTEQVGIVSVYVPLFLATTYRMLTKDLSLMLRYYLHVCKGVISLQVVLSLCIIN